MKRRNVGLALSVVGTLLTLGVISSLPSCGHDQKLVSIAVQPQTFTFLTPDTSNQEQFTATGTYIHPPATKDITNQVTWSVDAANIVTVNAGLVSPFGESGCGGVTITATAPEGTGGSSNIVTSSATAIVDDPSNQLCPGGGQLATLAVGVEGGGTVTSLPGGISCPGTCVATYNVNASVLLTANGPGVTWQNCPQSSGNSCAITIPTGGAAVIATFQ